MFDLEIGMALSDAACVLFGETLSTHTFCDALPQCILDEYPNPHRTGHL